MTFERKGPLTGVPPDVVSIADGGHRDRVLAERDALVEGNLALVDPIAARIKAKLPASFELDDLIAAGRFGLIRAATRFRPGAHNGTPFSAYARQVIRGAILDTVNRRHYVENTRPSLCKSNALTEQCPAPDLAIHAKRLHERIEAAILELPRRERAVMQEYYGPDEPTLPVVGARLGITAIRACQLHRQAIDKLRDRLQERAG